MQEDGQKVAIAMNLNCWSLLLPRHIFGEAVFHQVLNTLAPPHCSHSTLATLFLVCFCRSGGATSGTPSTWMRSNDVEEDCGWIEVSP